MAKRNADRVNLDQALRQAIVDTLEEYRPRGGRIRELMDEVRALRKTVGALERRIDRMSGRESAGRRTGTAGGGRPGRPPIFTHCKVSGCNRQHYAKGLCSMHYQQWRRTKEWPGPADLEPSKAASKKKTRKKKKTKARKSKSKTRR
jgi:hypothetical protein